MSTVVRPPTTRASSGRSLLLLGVLLALAAGLVVMFVISHYTAPTSQEVTVVVAAEDLHAGKILTNGPANGQYVPISQAFTTRSVNSGFLPANAYLYVSQEDLNTKLNNYDVVQPIFAGDFLRWPDPRLVLVGPAAGSLNLVNPGAIPTGDFIVYLQLSTTPYVVPNDHVDILVTECDLPGTSGCVTQDTLKNVLVYAVRDDYVFVVLGQEDALRLKYLTETGKIELALRAAENSATPTVAPVDASTIVSAFGF